MKIMKSIILNVRRNLTAFSWILCVSLWSMSAGLTGCAVVGTDNSIDDELVVRLRHRHQCRSRPLGRRLRRSGMWLPVVEQHDTPASSARDTMNGDVGIPCDRGGILFVDPQHAVRGQ